MKRFLDVLVSAVALAVLSPLLAFLAILVLLEDGSPVFYRGVRVGRQGRPFLIWKFRTMVVNAESIGNSSTAEDDPRVMNVGRVLRRYKLDELPQLLNVLPGHMSLVGPRPQVQWAVDLYTREAWELLRVRPGITDYASLVFRNEGAILRGSRDPDREYLEKIAPEKILLGLEYVRTRSMWTDLKILLATLGLFVGVDPSWCLPEHVLARAGGARVRGEAREARPS